MKILALEFSSARRSVAVLATEEAAQTVKLAEASESGGQSTRAFALVEEALRTAAIEREEITTIAVGLGPGSYTGIRAAIAIAQGWQLARNVHLVGISSVECLAHQARAAGLRGHVHVIVDAQRNELYLGSFNISADIVEAESALEIVPLDRVKALAQAEEIIIGPEADRWFSNARSLDFNLEQGLDSPAAASAGPAIFTLAPAASALAKLAVERTDYVQGEQLEPIYLRAITFVKAPPPRTLPAGFQ